MRTNHEFEFLPAALEIQESPPSPVGRAIIWSIIAFFVLALIWAVVGEVDIVATAQGKIIPSGRVKVIQPLEIGTVRRIHVVEGQVVAAGDLLLELDTTTTEADSALLEKESDSLRLQIQRLRHLIAYQGSGADSGAIHKLGRQYHEAMMAADPGSRREVELQRDILVRQAGEYAATIAALEKEAQRRQSELAAVQDQVAGLESTLPLINRRVNSIKSLAAHRLAAEYQLLELEEKRITRQQELASARNRVAELGAAVREVELRIAAQQEQFAKELLSSQQESERRLQTITADLVKVRQRRQLQRLVAPVDGVVQQLQVATIGGVVTPAQQLMLIVPQDQALEVEAFVNNRDVGFVHRGQPAEVKVETFPFTRYGTIKARIMDISTDAIQDEARGLVYASRVSLAQATMWVNGLQTRLTPGMAVTVEIRTGTRRLIEFLLNPLLRYRQESMRER